MLIFIYIVCTIQPLIKSLVIQSLRKDFINYIIQRGIAQAFILQIIFSQKTWLKALKILRLSSKATRFRLLLYTIYTYQVNSFSAVYIEYFSLTSIWLANSIPVFSIILDSWLTTIFLKQLPDGIKQYNQPVGFYYSIRRLLQFLKDYYNRFFKWLQVVFNYYIVSQY